MTEPKTISELMILVMEECKKGNINNAIIYLNEAIEIEPNDARFYISRGTFKEHENCEDAIEDYTKAIEIDPNYHFAYFNRARVKRELGDYQGAIDDYSKTGANSVLVAPIKIGSHVTIGAGSTISKDIPDKSLVVERSKAIIRTKTNER